MKEKYTTHVEPRLKYIQCLARDGLLEKDICKKIGVGVSTFARYKNENKELREALKIGKEDIDYQVENKLLKRAMGYKYTEKEKITDSDGNVTIKEKMKEVPPDVTAQIFWLKNRKKNTWRDRWDIELEDDKPININLVAPASDEK